MRARVTINCFFFILVFLAYPGRVRKLTDRITCKRERGVRSHSILVSSLVGFGGFKIVHAEPERKTRNECGSRRVLLFLLSGPPPCTTVILHLETQPFVVVLIYCSILSAQQLTSPRGTFRSDPALKPSSNGGSELSRT